MPLTYACFDSNIKEVGKHAFRSSDIQNVRFKAVEFFHQEVFNGCELLKALIIETPHVVSIDSILADHKSGLGQGTCYIYVPRALVDSYKVTKVWSNYANQFRALEDYTVDGTVTGELDESKI